MKLSMLAKIKAFAINKAFYILFPFLIIFIFTYNVEDKTELGLFFVAQSIALWVSLIVDFGMIRHGVYLINSGEVDNPLLIIIMQSLIMLIIAPFLYVTSFLFESLEFYDFIFILIFGSLSSLIPRWYYQARSMMSILTTIEMVVRFLTILALLIISVFIELNRLIIEVVLVFMNLLIFISATQRFFINIPNLRCVKKGIATLRTAFKILLSRIFGNLATNLNFIILSFFMTPEKIAMYGVCEKIVKAGIAVSTSVGEALYPSLIKRNVSKSFITRSIIISIVLSVIIIFTSIIAFKFVLVHFFNMDSGAIYWFNIMVLSVVFYSLSSIFSLFLFIAKKLYNLELISQIMIGVLSAAQFYLFLKYYGVGSVPYSFLFSSCISLFVIFFIALLYKHLRENKV